MNERAGPIRVLVVDDSAFVRQALSRMLGGDADLQVVGLAADGKDVKPLTHENAGWLKDVAFAEPQSFTATTATGRGCSTRTEPSRSCGPPSRAA